MRDYSPSGEKRRRRRDFSPGGERGRRRDYSPTEQSRRRRDYSPTEQSRRRRDYSPTEQSRRRRDYSPTEQRRWRRDYSPTEERRRRRDYSPTEERSKRDYFPSGGEGGPPSRRQFGGSWGGGESLTLQVYSSDVGKIIGKFWLVSVFLLSQTVPAASFLITSDRNW